MFWKIFVKFDRDREGTITLETFFNEIIGVERNLFGDAIFDLIDSEDTDVIEFGEFVQAVCTFAMFQVMDILRFSFFIFDKDKNGYIDKDELELFVKTLHNDGLTGNIISALKSITFNHDGKFDFAEFANLHDRFPAILYPAFRLQKEMRMKIGGTSWWSKKIGQLSMEKEEFILKLEVTRKKEEKTLKRKRLSKIRDNMGIVAYLKGGRYLDYHRRMNPSATVYVDAQQQIQVKYEEIVSKPGDDVYAMRATPEPADDPNAATF
jgi:Ca2+-binding EF-hand superfamily protein